MADLTAVELIRMVEFECLDTREGKSKIYDLFKKLSPEARKAAYEDGRDRYLGIGMSAEHANMTMLLDVAADLPDADGLEDKIESLRPEPP